MTMRDSIKMAIAAAALVATILAAPAEAASRTGGAADLECTSATSNVSAYVIHYSGWPALFVYDGWNVVLDEWADERIIEDSASITRIGYAAGGSVLDGGADLRIRTKDTRIPANEGSANLTARIGGRMKNVLLHCVPY